MAEKEAPVVDAPPAAVAAPATAAAGVEAPVATDAAGAGAGAGADVGAGGRCTADELAEFIPDVPPVEFIPPTVSWRGLEEAPRYYDHAETYPFLGPAMLPMFDTVVEEMKVATKWHAWPERSLYKAEEGHDWKVLPFVYTFPAYDPSQTEWVPKQCKQCPRTVALLRSLPGIRTALFSRLGPKTTLGVHQGWADLSNYVLRIHLPLTVPEENSCGLVVGGEVMYHKEGQLIVFDDSKKHYAFNNHPTESRSVLIFDLVRPEGLPKGLAKGAQTHELRAFIDYFK